MTAAAIGNARLVLPTEVVRGSVAFADGRIIAMDSGARLPPGAVDAEGDYLLPGLIDLHTDDLERQLEPRPGVSWPGIAALIAHDRMMIAAGTTTVFDSLCAGDQRTGSRGRQETLRLALDALADARRAGLLQAEHVLHLRCEISSVGVVETFATFVDDPSVRLVSLMDHTPGQRQWANLPAWRRGAGSVLDGATPELDLLIERRRQQQASIAPAARQAVVQLARQRGLVLASHDDQTPEHVTAAVADGVTVAEFPTTLAAARAARAAGLAIIMGAPNVVLGGSHAGNVSARHLAALGLLDGLASDYVPGSLIQACFVLHQVVGIDLAAAVATATRQPATFVGLTDRGAIAPGLRADLVRVSPCRLMPVVRAVWQGGRRVA